MPQMREIASGLKFPRRPGGHEQWQCPGSRGHARNTHPRATQWLKRSRRGNRRPADYTVPHLDRMGKSISVIMADSNSRRTAVRQKGFPEQLYRARLYSTS